MTGIEDEEEPEPRTVGPPELLAEILRHIPVGVSVSAPNGELLYGNEAAARHGVPPGEDKPAARASAEERRRVARVGDRAIEIVQRSLRIRGAPYEIAVSSDITEQVRLQDDLFRRAYFDDLTRLPNRCLLEKAVDDLIISPTNEAKFALAFLDFDNFKHINDYYGHSVGDDLLVKAARRISELIRPTDLLARIGGDEFVLLISPIGDEDIASDLARISARLKEPYFIEGHEIFSSASTGVSFFPRDGRSFEALRSNADVAMYRVKGGAKGGVNFFDRGIGQKAAERAKIEQRIRLAIRDRRLCCAFQPKVDFRSDAVVGLEVLLRWEDEEGVIQPPGDFVNLAVDLGLMDDITLLVLAEAVKAVDRIDEGFGPDTSISVNVAAKQAGDYRFMRTFTDALEATGYPERFVVELTEEAFLQRSQFQMRVAPMLREVGAKISIDDFGVGYSSLATLADITADEIKVDRSFITDIHQRPRSQTLLKAIESLGAALGMSVIVEGVETFEELAYLEAATRIRYAQGFYFARPMFFEQIPSARRSDPELRTEAASRGIAASRQSNLRPAVRGGGRG